MYNFYGYQNQQIRLPRHINVTELRHVILIRKGKVESVLEPGRHRLRRRVDQLWADSAAPEVLQVPNQEVLTSDGVTVKVTAIVVAQIVDPLLARSAGDWRGRLHIDTQLALRTLVTQKGLEDLMSDRAALDAPLLEAVTASAAELGVDVTKVALRDLMVPGEQRRMLAEVVSARLAGQAALERARAETAALRNLANAAALVRDNPAMFQLRLLQEMGSSSGHTFVVGTDAIPVASRPTEPS